MFKTLNSKAIRPGMMAMLAAATLVGLAGCSEGPTVIPVTGTVTHNGTPVPNLVVHFRPHTGRPSWGQTDSSGKYSLSYSKQQDGAVVGTHSIVVTYAEPRSDDPSAEMAAMFGRTSRPPEVDAVLAKYGPTGREKVTVEVKDSAGFFGASEQVIDLQLD